MNGSGPARDSAARCGHERWRRICGALAQADRAPRISSAGETMCCLKLLRGPSMMGPCSIGTEHLMKVIVVGAGIMGGSAAYHLARAGSEVTLVDRADEGRATAAGAGIVCPWGSSIEDAWRYALLARGARYYSQIVAMLAEDGERDLGYARVGGLYVPARTSSTACASVPPMRRKWGGSTVFRPPRPGRCSRPCAGISLRYSYRAVPASTADASPPHSSAPPSGVEPGWSPAPPSSSCAATGHRACVSMAS